MATELDRQNIEKKRKCLDNEIFRYNGRNTLIAGGFTFIIGLVMLLIGIFAISHETWQNVLISLGAGLIGAGGIALPLLSYVEYESRCNHFYRKY